jgi:hypothetical protein
MAAQRQLLLYKRGKIEKKQFLAERAIASKYVVGIEKNCNHSIV